MKELSSVTVLGWFALHLMLRSRRPLSARELHQLGHCPLSRIQSILRKLKRGGLVRSRPGRGYELAKAPGEISVRDVAETLEGLEAPQAPCGGDYEACDTRASCILAPLCRRAGDSFREALRSFTLADLVNVSPALPECHPFGRETA